MNPYYAIVYVLIQVILAFFSAVVSVIVAYGAIVDRRSRSGWPGLYSILGVR